MKKSIAILLGVYFSISSVYAGNNHIGNHMYEDKMTNHSNPNSVSNKELNTRNEASHEYN